jgi:hypothetical protein
MRRKVVAFIVGSMGLMAASVAQAESLTFRVQSHYTYAVQIEFYSQSRNSAWPGGSQAYNLKDSEVHDFRLNCNAGEKICYGAWVSGNQRQYWGAGMHGRQGCSKCCFVCDGSETPVITLNN